MNEQANKKRQTKKVVLLVCLIVCGTLVVAGVIWFAKYLKSREENLPGTFVEEQGADHVDIGADHDPYSSNPPTSGPHYEDPAEWGYYREQLPDEQLVHNLEHGGVWISYKPGISADIIQELEGLFEAYGSKKMIVTPRPQNDFDIALAVWTRYEKFNVSEYSRARVENFISQLRNKTAPEPFAP